MKKLFITLSLFAVAAVQADVIGVLDGGRLTFHTDIEDHSTGGDTIGSMSGTFASDAFQWATDSREPNAWNDTGGAFNNSGNTATWTFGNLSEGSEWDVFVTWNEGLNRSLAVPYKVQGSLAATITQKNTDPLADLVLNDGQDHNFQKIGTVTIDGTGSLIVTMTDPNDGAWAMSGAVAIQMIPEPATLGLVAMFGGGILFIRRKLML